MWVDEWEKCYLGQCVLQAWSQHDAADHCGHQQEDGVPYQLKSGDHMYNIHTAVCIIIDCLHDPTSNGGVAHARAALADRTGCWTKAAEKEKS